MNYSLTGMSLGGSVFIIIVLPVLFSLLLTGKIDDEDEWKEEEIPCPSIEDQRDKEKTNRWERLIAFLLLSCPSINRFLTSQSIVSLFLGRLRREEPIDRRTGQQKELLFYLWKQHVIVGSSKESQSSMDNSLCPLVGLCFFLY